MFSSPLLSTRNQNEVFVFVPVFSRLREREAPIPARRVEAPAPNQILRLMPGARGKTLCRNTLELWLEAPSAANHKPGRPRSKTRTPPLARRRRSGHIGERVTPSQSRAAVAWRASARFRAPMGGIHAAGVPRYTYISNGWVIRTRDGSTRRRNAPPETVKRPSRAWRVVGSAM